MCMAKCTTISLPWTLYKIALQMHVPSEELTATVELNFNKYTEC